MSLWPGVNNGHVAGTLWARFVYGGHKWALWVVALFLRLRECVVPVVVSV